MGDWSLTWNAQEDTAGMTFTSSQGTGLTASASANVKGAWAQLIAATPIDAHSITVIIAQSTGDQMIDIAIGPAGQEHIIVPNLMTGSITNQSGRAVYYLPIQIPKNSRLAGRNQSTTGGVTATVLVMLFSHGPGAPPPMHQLTDYGTNTADSGGTGIDPGTSLNTKNAWSQLVAATARPIRALMIGIGNQANTAMTTATWLCDVGIGPGGQEYVIIPDILLSANTTGDAIQPWTLGPFPVSIPPGSRIAAHAQCSISTAADRLFDIAVYGVE